MISMLVKELWPKAKEIYEQYIDEYAYIGIRFETKIRTVGEICECSRHNIDREDERDFPEYGTEEYFDMPEFDGTSAWDLRENSIYKTFVLDYWDINADCTRYYAEHCYIIVGDSITNRDDGLDNDEIVIENAKVIEVLY